MPVMNWTKEAPTKEGYYWFRWPSYGTPDQYEIAEARRVSPGKELHVRLFDSSGNEFEPLFKYPGGEWYGPLEPPE